MARKHYDEAFKRQVVAERLLAQAKQTCVPGTGCAARRSGFG